MAFPDTTTDNGKARRRRPAIRAGFLTVTKCEAPGTAQAVPGNGRLLKQAAR